jgi:alpha-glucosidase
VLGNHDVCRPVSRYARPQDALKPMDRFLSDFLPLPADFAAGLRRTRAAALMMFGLPGGAYVYQGEELGLPEAEAIPFDQLQDPMVGQTDGANLGRDGCRVPLPWTASGESFGFSPEGGSTPWLPQPSEWAALAADTQDGKEGSTLEFYRQALRLRGRRAELGDGTMTWIDSPADVLAYSRGEHFQCWVNFGTTPITLPAGELLVASGPLNADGSLPTDTTVWLAV